MARGATGGTPDHEDRSPNYPQPADRLCHLRRRGQRECTNPVERAFAAHDIPTLTKYARFLEPILKTMIENAPNPDKVREYLANMRRQVDSPQTKLLELRGNG
jgi:hypothetical protein